MVDEERGREEEVVEDQVIVMYSVMDKASIINKACHYKAVP